MGILVKLPEGAAVSIDRDDARRLVDALWQASATSGAVVAIGKIEHRLGDGGEPVVEVSELEAGAIGTALARAESLPVGLVRLREAMG